MSIVSTAPLVFPRFDDFIDAVRSRSCGDASFGRWSMVDTGSFWIRPMSDVVAVGCGEFIPLYELLARFRMIPAESGMCPSVRDGVVDDFNWVLRQWWSADDVWHCLFDSRAAFHQHLCSMDVWVL